MHPTVPLPGIGLVRAVQDELAHEIVAADAEKGKVTTFDDAQDRLEEAIELLGCRTLTQHPC